MSGFSDPLVGAGGSLVYPSIHSPNYVLNVSGWSVNKNGTAQFTGVVLVGGSFTGTEFILNSAGLFFYNGTPAFGNLEQSVASGGGTDALGNGYLGGTCSYGTLDGTYTALRIFEGGFQWQTAATAAGPFTVINSITWQPSTGGSPGFSITALNMFLQTVKFAVGVTQLVVASSIGATPATTALAEIQGALALVLASVSTALQVQVAGDTVPRLVINGNGTHSWGSGSAAADAVLSRVGAGSLQLTSTLLQFASASAGAAVIPVFVTGDTADRWVLNSNGVQQWGPGSAATDTQLYRAGVTELAASPIALDVSGSPETWHSITTGFPANWTGHVNYRKLSEAGGLCMIDWAFSIAAATVITGGESLTVSVPSGYFYASDNKVVQGSLGGGLSQFAPMQISAAGLLQYGGVGGTVGASTAFWYGQGVYETQV